jgi:hypothetical protein
MPSGFASDSPFVHPPTTSSSISLDMLDVGFYARSPLAAWTRVNHRVFLCLLCERDEDVFLAHLPNNLGGVTPGVRERTRDIWRTR